MTPKLIKTEEEYDAALERIDALFDAKSGTQEGTSWSFWRRS